MFLAALGVIGRRRFPARRILTSGAIAVAGFVLVATPIMIAESHIPRSSGIPSDYDPQHSTYMIYPEARERERQWVYASSIAEGLKTNIRWGLGAFNNTVTDNGNIYVNPGHGFVDPLTGILLWLGIGLIVVRLVRRELDEGELLAVAGFVSLWLGVGVPRQQGAELHAPARHAALCRVPRHRCGPLARRSLALALALARLS